MAIKRRYLEEPQVGKPAPAWLLTYADVVTQILVFFVLLFSLSNIDVMKFSSYFKKMKKPPVLLDEEQLRRVMVEIAAYAQEKGLEDAIRMEITERGLTINLTEKLMFKSGSADILPQALPVLDEIVEKLRYIPNEINIEGHTDNVPIRTERFDSNWELSTARATNIVRYFVEEKGIDPKRISASGYGEYRPIATNDTVEGRALNRRVVLIVLRMGIK